MQYPFSDKKALTLLIVGLVLCVVAVTMMLVLHLYGGLFVLVPLTGVYVFQLAIYIRNHRKPK